MEKDGRTKEYTNGSLIYISQIKQSDGYYRANLHHADLDGSLEPPKLYCSSNFQAQVG